MQSWINRKHHVIFVVAYLSSGSFSGSWWTATAHGANFCKTCSHENGMKPAPRKPLLHCCGVKDVSYSFAIKLGKSFLPTCCPFVSSLYHLRIALQALFIGAKTRTSSGWRRWVVFGERHRSKTFLLCTLLMCSKLMMTVQEQQDWCSFCEVWDTRQKLFCEPW